MDVRLSSEDLAELARATDHAPGRRGDCYELENDRSGPHGRIMRYNQNEANQKPAG